MNDDDHRDDHDSIAERVLAALEAGESPAPRGTAGAAGAGTGVAAEDELLERLYTEVLGLLPYELPERPPRPEARENLLAAVRQRQALRGAASEAGEDGARHQRGRAPRVAPFPVHPVGSAQRPIAAQPVPGAEVDPAPATTTTTAPAVTPAGRRAGRGAMPAALPAWTLALAATLLLAVLALGAFSGWLYARMGHQEELLAALQDDLHQAERRADALATMQGNLERRRLDLASQLALITTPGVEVCPLHPVGDAPPFPEARGLLFLSNVREEWYVRLSGLGPAPAGQAYRLWFLMGDDRAVDAGLLLPGADEAIALSGTEMPDPGRMTGALVTLEPEGEPAETPDGPRVLFGDEKMLMI